jgi:hypothetical protein
MLRSMVREVAVHVGAIPYLRSVKQWQQPMQPGASESGLESGPVKNRDIAAAVPDKSVLLQGELAAFVTPTRQALSQCVPLRSTP